MQLLELEKLLETAEPYLRQPCVYLLFLRRSVVYVGCSNHPSQRISGHATGKHAKDFDSYKVIKVPDGVDMEELERLYIVKFRPPMNNRSLLSDTFVAPPEASGPIGRAMKRMELGQPASRAAAAEGIKPEEIYATEAYRAWKDEKNQLLLQRRNARKAEASLRKDGNVSVGIHPESHRGGAKEARPVRISQQKMFD
jgi:hypothetical protein